MHNSFTLFRPAAVIRGGRRLLLLLALVALPVITRAGELEQFFYLPLNGANVTDLTAAPEFPEQPFAITPVNWFHTGLEGITNASTAYGSWLRGYLEPPVSGDYTFYLSAGDSAEFYLSSDHLANHRQLLASVATAVPYGIYNRQSFQRSTTVTLERGQQYYFEIRHKSEVLPDHVQVGWLRPDDVLERPIPLHHVQRFVPQSYEGPGVREAAANAPVIEAAIPMGIAWENERVVLAPNVSATPPVYYQWFRNGVPLTGENLSSLDLGAVTEADSGAAYTLLAATPAGIALSDDWPLQVWNDATAPTILHARTTGMTNGFVLTFSEPVDPGTATDTANYAMNLGIGITDVALLHGTNLTTVVVRTTPFPSVGIPVVTVNGVRDQAQPPNEIAPASSRTVSLADGRITLRYQGAVDGHTPVGGTSIDDIPGPGGQFQFEPALTRTSTEMGIPRNIANDYAAQLIGYLVPPVTGDYRFLISSDDQGLLYLSPDANPANKRAIAFEPQWNGWRNYLPGERRTLLNTGNNSLIATLFPGITNNVLVNDSLNTVGPIHLEAGRRYYIEAVMKEGGGGDNLDVAWQLPGGLPVVDGQAAIPGEFLAQWSGADSGDVAITNQPVNFSVLEGRHATFRVGVKGTQPCSFQWFRNGVRIVDANEATHVFPAHLADSSALYTVRVRNDFSEVWSAEARLVVWPDATRPHVVRAFADQHFDKVTLWFDEPVTTTTATNVANYWIARTDNGQLLLVTAAEARGFSDGGYTNVLLRTATIMSGVNYTVRTAGITDLSEGANATRPEDAATFTGWVASRGFALYERWDNVPLGGINAPAQYRNTHEPDVSNYLTRFESPMDVAENYLGRISGFFVAPTAGRHDFYMSSDENGELWMANDSGSFMAQTRIAFEPSWGNARSWTGTSDGRRTNGDNNTLGDNLPLLTMAAGEHRYLELLWKEAGGGDYAHASYSGPGEPPPQIGSTSRLTGRTIAAWGNPDAVTITFQNDLEDRTGQEQESMTFQVHYSAASWNAGQGVTTFIQWQTNGVDVTGANGSTFTLNPLSLSHEALRVRCLISAPGRTVSTREAVVTVMPDIQPPRVRVMGSPNLSEVWVIFDEPVGAASALDPSNYSIPGRTIHSVRFLRPGNQLVVILATDPLTPGEQINWRVEGVRDVSTAQNLILPAEGTFTTWTLQPGWVRREAWTNIAGARVADLTSHLSYSQGASQLSLLPALEAPVNIGDYYGQRLSGWLQVTNTADYLFAIAADRQAVFYLSIDENPANKRAIVTEPEWNGERDWNGTDRRINSGGDDFFPQINTLPVNRSQNTVGSIGLNANQRYYFELLHKDGGGGDHASVTMWPANELMPVNGSPGLSGALVWNYLNPDNITLTEEPPAEVFLMPHQSFVLSVTAHAFDGPLQYPWERNGVPVLGGTGASLIWHANALDPDGTLFRCRVSAPGATVVTRATVLTPINEPRLFIRPYENQQVRVLWPDAFHPTPKLQWTPRLYPPALWTDLPWNGPANGVLEWIIDPQSLSMGSEGYFRMVPAE